MRNALFTIAGRRVLSTYRHNLTRMKRDQSEMQVAGSNTAAPFK